MRAKSRLADEYDAAQERGEVAGNGQRGPEKAVADANSFSPATAADLGLRRDEIYEARQISAQIDKAENLRRWFLESWQHPEIMMRDVVRLGPNALRESPKARAALGILEKHGWLVRLDAGAVVRGAARAEAWRIVRGGGDVV